jgi:prepilin peptidase CpaA
LLLIAAYRDVLTRSIPDSVSIILAVFGVTGRVLIGPSALAVSIVAGISLFLLLLLAHGRGMLGGGDVKLMAAVACGLSLPELYRFILVTGVSGGVLAGIHLWLRHMLKDFAPMKPPVRGTFGLYRVLAAERWRIARRGPLPYGVAIACGGIAVLGQRLPW